MKPLKSPVFTVYSLLCTFLGICSCTQESSVPFPENPSGFEAPVTVPFELPDTEPVNWKVFSSDSVPKGNTIQLDVESLPYTPFSANEFKPLKAPLKITSFDWEKLESIQFNLDTIQSKPIPVKKFLLPAPLVTAASVPSVWQGSTSAMVRLGQPEGLLGNKVFAMVTDPQGSIWITTERGLTKYDGSEFHTYNFFGRSETGAIEILPKMLFDSQGRLIISGLVSGVYRLDITLGLVEHFQLDKGFIRMDYDAQGKLWGTNGGLYFLNLEEKRISQLEIKTNDTTINTLFGVKNDKEGNLWIGLGQGIGIMDPTQKYIRLMGDPIGLNLRTAYEFKEDYKGNMWVSAFSSGAFSINLRDKTYQQMGPEQGYFGRTADVLMDEKKRLWLISEDTVRLFDQENNLVKKIVTRAVTRDNNFPSSSIVGKDGTIWIGTDKVGILLVNPNGLLSEYFMVENGIASNDVWGINEDSKGRIWLGNYRGLNIYDAEKERLYLFQFPGGPLVNDFRQINEISEGEFFVGMARGFSILDLNSNTATIYDSRSTLGITTIFTAEQTADGKLWMGSGFGLLVFDPKENSLKQLGESNGLSSDMAFVVKKDSKGQIWVCTDTGVHLFDAEGKTQRKLNQETGLMTDYNSMLFETAQGEIIFGGDEGFSIFDQDKKTITHVSGKSGISPPSLYDMNESKGRIHVGSENGIIVVERPNENSPNQLWRFVNFGKSSGLPYNDHNQATSFVSSTGAVWWGAAPILVVNHQDPLIDSLPPQVHIKGINIMDQNPVFLKSDYFRYALSAGDTLWSSDLSAGWTKETLPADSSYLARNKINWDSISPGFRVPVGLQLPYHQNSFNFTFVNQAAQGRDKIVYRYILEGEDDEWSAISPKPASRIYYNLLPGAYTFRVATRGFNGVWSQPESLSFTILPPWWQTWWAYVLFASVFGGLTYGIVYIRSLYLKKENRILEEKVSHRTEQLKKSIEDLKATQSQLIHAEKMASLGELTAGIAHEIQNPLNFVNNFSEVSEELVDDMNEELLKGDFEEAKSISKDLKENLKKIKHHGKRADSIVKGMLEHSRGTTSDKKPTNLNELSDEFLRLSYHGLRAKDKSFTSDFETDFDPNLPLVNVVAQDIGRVILNLINNAFYACAERNRGDGGQKSTTTTPSYKPKVTVQTRLVSLTDASGGVEISIKDNGSGIPKAIKDKIFQPFFTTKPTGSGTGLGLSLSYDIIKAHGGDLRVKSTEGEGTEMIIFLPIES
ncbi:ATP-binding protein [Algoriphagus litoralis]|uniref:ATP-binding protein n=1 Tax=Algoriphagus litoralis TaxID=2202829 RepID=UPI0018E569BD|nr:ATP-binding protein [Algoriphagus litoralis]